MKKKILAIMLSLTMVMGLVACGSKDSADTQTPADSSNTEEAKEPEESSQEEETKTEEKKEYEVLNVGTMALTMGIPVLYAQEQGYFEDAGLNVNIEIF